MVGCGKHIADGLETRMGTGERRERDLDMHLLALSLGLAISTFRCFYQCPEKRQKACFLNF